MSSSPHAPLAPQQSRRGTWVAIVAALVLAVMVLGTFASMASKLGGVQDNDIASWLPGDAESTEVIERASELASDDESPAIIAFVRDSGITAADVVAARDALLELQEFDPNVVSVISPPPWVSTRPSSRRWPPRRRARSPTT